MVTFKKVDPLYVIDLKDAENPKVLGYLKIPGYSNYLHPYDENHIIGIGKDAVETSNGWALYQGMKISLFDVSDFENPKEEASLIIGDRGTDSYALYEHKAFLFSKERDLLVLPINLAKINESQYSKYGEKLPDWAYGQSVWQGAYVFNISEKGISVRGRITHFESDSVEGKDAKNDSVGAMRVDKKGIIYTKIKEDYWVFNDYANNRAGAASDIFINDETIAYKYNIYDNRFQIQRSLYMDDVLYTISPSAIKANNLNNLNEINKVEISST